MTEAGLIFSAPLIPRLLDRTKRQTRRLDRRLLRLKAGDRIWVRETWYLGRGYDGLPPRDVPPNRALVKVGYLADGSIPVWGGKVRSPLHLPRWASRIELRLTEDARAEHLWDITEADARVEGFVLGPHGWGFGGEWGMDTAKDAYAFLWQELHGTSWHAENPEVVRLAFEPW